MKISVYAAYDHVVERTFREQQVVVIDLLRATTTILTALLSGAKCVLPVAEVESAMSLAAHIQGDFLLAGERKAVLIQGFDLGNSPFEYTPEVVEGKSIIFTTTNGSRALQRVASAPRIWLGCLRNAAAVADAMLGFGLDATIVCAGTGGRFTIDDFLAAGCILDRLQERVHQPPDLNDLGVVALDVYRRHRFHLFDLLRQAGHYGVLMESGFERDIQYCMQEDVETVVPRFADGAVTLL